MQPRVVVTGIGVICPVGNNLQTAWNQLINGKTGIGPVRLYDASEMKVKIAAEVKDFDPSAKFGAKEARRLDRYTQFALTAAEEALQQARLEITDPNRDDVGIIIGSGIGGVGSLVEQMHVFNEKGPGRVSPFLIPMMLPDSAAGMLAIHFGARGPNMSVTTACATGTNAIGEAAAMIQRGAAKVMLAGGSEAALLPITMAGLSVMNAMSTRNDEPERASRPFDRLRDGFVMGEGAAVLVLEALEHAQARGAQILAEVSGYGTTNDAHHITAPIETGAGAARCMELALASANLQPNQVGYINAHGTSTPLNDKSETAAIRKAFGEHAYRVPISSTKSMTGHLLGAAGALEAAVSIMALLTGILPPTINYENLDSDCDLDYVPNFARRVDLAHAMSNSFGFGGHNATLIFSAFRESGQ